MCVCMSVCKCDECSFFNYCINMDYESVNKDLLQPAGTSPLWADHIFLIISCGSSGRLHDICVSLLIKYTSIIH